MNDPDISDETKQTVAFAAGSAMLAIGTAGIAPEVVAGGAAIREGVKEGVSAGSAANRQGGRALGRRLFGKDGLLNRGPNIRFGLGREGGRGSFRVAAKWLGKVPEGIRTRLGIKEIKDGVYKWDWWGRGPL